MREKPEESSITGVKSYQSLSIVRNDEERAREVKTEDTSGTFSNMEIFSGMCYFCGNRSRSWVKNSIVHRGPADWDNM